MLRQSHMRLLLRIRMILALLGLGPMEMGVDLVLDLLRLVLSLFDKRLALERHALARLRGAPYPHGEEQDDEAEHHHHPERGGPAVAVAVAAAAAAAAPAGCT